MRRSGFTLIELMVVVAIIGLLSAIAVPNFQKFQCRAKKTEGKNGLGLIAKAEEAYRAENDVYAFGPEAQQLIGALITGKRYYNFQVNDLSVGPEPGFLATGTGIVTTDVSGDTMSIDTFFRFTQVTTDVCQ
jgi:prepilin-type N-terminal cleavage/methylation domain-containing protein